MLGMSPEEVVIQAVRMLKKNVNSEACIDSLLQEQVCSINSFIWYFFSKLPHVSTIISFLVSILILHRLLVSMAPVALEVFQSKC